jgi:hypothetical protein
VRGQLGKGVIVGSWFTKGEPPKGQAFAEYAEVRAAFEAEALEALQKQKVPAEYKEYVRDYFDAIRGDKSAAPPK